MIPGGGHGIMKIADGRLLTSQGCEQIRAGAALPWVELATAPAMPFADPHLDVVSLVLLRAGIRLPPGWLLFAARWFPGATRGTLIHLRLI